MEKTSFYKNKKLKVKVTNEVLAFDIILAKSYLKRLVGLMGKKSFERHRALWLYPCSSIHTFFMQFSIDVIFVNQSLVVKAFYEDIKPWKYIPPVEHGFSVFEFYGGALKDKKIKIGDQLNVGA